MILALASQNHLASATVSTNARAFERGLPAANAFLVDPLRRAQWRGGQYVVTAGVNDKVNFNAGTTATLNAGTYYGPAEYAGEVARAMTAAAAAAWFARIMQGSTTPRRMELGRVDGTASTLENATGANQATSALKLGGGFRNADRASTAVHVGDYAACCYPYASLLVDMGSTKTSLVCAVVAPACAPGTIFAVATGPTSAVAGTTYLLGDRYSSDVSAQLLATPDSSRWAELRVYSARGETVPHPAVGYWFLGPAFDTDSSADSNRLEWEWASYRTAFSTRFRAAETITGHQSIAEVEPGEEFAVGFTGRPGMSRSHEAALQDLVDTAGTTGYALVMLDPTGEPCRESRYCRMTAPPTWKTLPIGGPYGRMGVEFRFAAQGTR